MSSAFFDPDDFDTTSIATVAAPVSTPVSAPVSAPISAPVAREPVIAVAAEKPKFFELKPVGSAAAPAAAAISPAPTPVAAAPAAEPIRMPEPLTLPSDFPAFVAPEGMTVDLSDLAIGSDEPLTRRQLREIQRLTGSDVINETPVADISIETEIDYEPDLAEQLAEQDIDVDRDSSPSEYTISPATAEDFSYMNAQAEPMFDVSPGLVIEPTTNSIIIDQVQDLTNYTATVSETGEILTTGAIQLPIAISDNGTGEIQIIQEAAALDSAIQVDNSTGFINTIAPMRVTGVVNAISKFKVIPTNLKRGSSHPYLVLAAAVGMVALGGLVIAIFMLQTN
jgi:hypothetical protein